MDKKKVPFDLTDWEDYCPAEIPHQLNGFDCGVFMCKFAESCSRDLKNNFNFAQKHMPYFRKRMILEILEKRVCL